ncbi:MAG TPA: 16S rRNA (cytosine(967)-C(5))-methyltransferase RsmB [Luteimonas sp.]|nr:16S rRNA (cytosine(967)-C(5))-methyltransferase RsmB [Luteimonas sp.]
MSTRGAAARVLAARVLDAVLHHGRSLKAELAQALPALPDPRDRALVEAICFAVLRNRVRYATALSAWISRSLPRRDEPLRALLYVGFAQLDVLGLAPHAAVDSTVEAARCMGRTHQVALVNALLRRAQRDGLPPADPVAQWPDWLRARLGEDWGDDAEAVFAQSAIAAPLWLRVNRARGSVESYRARLREVGIEARPHATFADALRIDSPVAVADLPGFAAGDASVQDGAAQSVADALAPAAGARVLDACAAPGGKSAHLLERDATLRVTALDVDGARLQRVADTYRRVGVGADAVLRVADATTPEQWWDGVPFDAVLLDAPCSATGIVRRQPDVLLHRREDDIAALSALQGALLDAAWRVLRPGGALVYATCSILAAENATVCAAFLARTRDASAVDPGDAFGRRAGCGRQRLPGDDGMDGFFVARLEKVAR